MAALDELVYRGLTLRNRHDLYSRFSRDISYTSEPYPGFVDEVSVILKIPERRSDSLYKHASEFVEELSERLGNPDLSESLDRYIEGFLYNDTSKHFDFVSGEWVPDKSYYNPLFLATRDPGLIFSLRILIEAYLKLKRSV